MQRYCPKNVPSASSAIGGFVQIEKDKSMSAQKLFNEF